MPIDIGSHNSIMAGPKKNNGHTHGEKKKREGISATCFKS